MADKKPDFGEMFRKGINEKAEAQHKARVKAKFTKGEFKPVALTLKEAGEIEQVHSWIPMPEWWTASCGIQPGQGIPCGHITQIIGKSDSGKTTQLCEIIKQTIQNDGMVIYLDVEKKFDLKRLAEMGCEVDDSNFFTMDCEYLEDVWNAWKAVVTQVEEIRKDFPDKKILCIWDSVAASVPKKTGESIAGAAQVSVEAKINNQEVRKLRSLIKQTQVAAVFVNHSYFTMPKSSYEVSEEVVKGGEELFYQSTLIIKLKKGAKKTREVKVKGTVHKQQIGRVTKMSWLKNHLASRTAEVEMIICGPGYLSEEEFKKHQTSLRGSL